MSRLFRTDGVRGVANRDLTCPLALRLGAAYGAILCAGFPLGEDGGVNQRADRRPRIVIGRDSRVSGDMLEAAFLAGACSAGVDVHRVGILPTPAIAYLVRALSMDGGVMISASHNPIADNGIKIFSARGFKISDEIEERIETLMMDPPLGPTGGDVGRAADISDAEDRYARFVVEHTQVRLDRMRVVLDCAYGSAWHVAPRVFRELGATVTSLHDQADGTRINVSCGSTDLTLLAETVRREAADIGLAFDGDADRCLAVDETAEAVNGDQMLLAFARTRGPGGGGLCNEAQREPGARVIVATVMSNLGLEMGLRDLGCELRRAAVGDRFVLEEMLRCGAILGGEQSGHIIFLDAATTGDGLLTATRLASAVRASGQPLGELARMAKVPQMLVNVNTANKDRLNDDPEITAAIAEVETLLAGRGRLLVRPSGTEPMVRVMVEGPDADELDRVVSRLVTLIERRLQ